MKKLLYHPRFIFFPFLIIYLLLAWRLYNPGLYGDEKRYMEFAQNLINGFYSSEEELNIWNGPGYPLILAPIIALGLTKKAIVVLNVLFQYTSIIVLYKTLLHYTTRKIALIASLFWASYYVAYQEMVVVFSEPLTILLITSIAYFFTVGSKTKRLLPLILSGICVGYLILTKVIFWYPFIVLLCLYSLLYVYSGIRKSKETIRYRRVLTIWLVAFIVVTPYLIYTFHLTGRPFYLANSGGMSLYWMSTPYEGEYGDWNGEDFAANCFPGTDIPCNADYFRKNHENDIAYVQQFTGVAKDDAYKRLAMQNIKNHPVKYLKNCVANIGRLWFGFPFSYFFQRDRILLRIPPNAVLFCLCVIALPLHLYNYKRVRPEIRFLTLFFFLYLSFSVLVSAYQRQFYVIVPLMIIWLTYILTRTISLRINIGRNYQQQAQTRNQLHSTKTNKVCQEVY